MIFIKKGIYIIEKDISLKNIKSSGPGGQSINKVSTGVHLKYPILPNHYPVWFIENLKEKYNGLISKKGFLNIKVISNRSQLRNRKKAIDKLIEIFSQATKTNKKRIKTSPTKSSQLKRLDIKRKNSLKKEYRKNIKSPY